MVSPFVLIYISIKRKSYKTYVTCTGSLSETTKNKRKILIYKSIYYSKEKIIKESTNCGYILRFIRLV